MDVILVRGLRFSTNLGNVSTLLTKYLPVSACYTCHVNTTHWRSTFSERYPRYKIASRNSLSLASHILTYRRLLNQDTSKNEIGLVYYSDFKQSPKDEHQAESQAESKMSVFQKMKQMTKDYWYILLPVHVITSIGWMALFYTAVRNGVDIVQLLEYMSFSERYIDLVRNSSAGNWAIAYALYKIFTPVRYTITVGGTTVAIRYLSKLGYVKTLSFKRQSVEPVQSSKCAAGHETKFKAECKTERHAESPKP